MNINAGTEKKDRHFADDILKFKKTVVFRVKFYRNPFPGGPIYDMLLARITAWFRTGDNLLSEPMVA